MDKGLKITLICFIILTVSLSQASADSLAWNSSSDWDNAEEASGVVHESFGDNRADQVKLGWSRYGSQGSLTGYWPLDDGSGSVASDVSGSGNDGSIGNVDLGKDGVFGTSSFEFKGDNIVISNPNELPTGDSAFSTVFWFKNLGANSNGGILHWGSNSGSRASGQEVRDGGWQHYFYSNDNGCYNIGMWDGNWHMAVVTYDTSSNTRKMFLDSNLECSDDAGNVDMTNTEIQIGGGDSSDMLSGARLDEVRIWNRALSSQEISDLYNSAFSGEINTSWKNFRNDIDVTDLKLEKTSSSLNGQSISLRIYSDTDENGEVDEISEKISLNGSGGPYNVEGLSTDSRSFKISANLNSDSASRSPVLKEVRLAKPEIPICDSRGPVNECISNSRHEISGEKFDVTSMFRAEESAVFKAFNGKATLNLTNSSSISGLWKGAIRIQAERPRLKSGARFRPQGERIIIGN